MQDDDDLDGIPAEDSPYAVGYKKPPRQHRFRRGNKAAAGKRRNRQKAKVHDLLKRLMAEKVTVSIDGKRRRMTMLEASLRSLVNDARKSPRDMLRLLTLLRDLEGEPFADVQESKVTIEFVSRDWSDNPLPGSPEWERKHGKAGNEL